MCVRETCFDAGKDPRPLVRAFRQAHETSVPSEASRARSKYDQRSAAPRCRRVRQTAGGRAQAIRRLRPLLGRHGRARADRSRSGMKADMAWTPSCVRRVLLGTPRWYSDEGTPPTARRPCPRHLRRHAALTTSPSRCHDSLRGRSHGRFRHGRFRHGRFRHGRFRHGRFRHGRFRHGRRFRHGPGQHRSATALELARMAVPGRSASGLSRPPSQSRNVNGPGLTTVCRSASGLSRPPSRRNVSGPGLLDVPGRSVCGLSHAKSRCASGLGLLAVPGRSACGRSHAKSRCASGLGLLVVPGRSACGRIPMAGTMPMISLDRTSTGLTHDPCRTVRPTPAAWTETGMPGAPDRGASGRILMAGTMLMISLDRTLTGLTHDPCRNVRPTPVAWTETGMPGAPDRGASGPSPAASGPGLIAVPGRSVTETMAGSAGLAVCLCSQAKVAACRARLSVSMALPGQSATPTRCTRHPHGNAPGPL